MVRSFGAINTIDAETENRSLHDRSFASGTAPSTLTKRTSSSKHSHSFEFIEEKVIDND